MENPNLRLKSRIILLFGTAEDFAEQIGVHPSIVSRVVRGRRKLTAESEKKWAEALKCAPDNIFKHDAS
jgi:transcriptional regulator with XRE-family HTH domain